MSITLIELYVIERVRELRIKNKMSQSELSFHLNLASGFVGKVESKNTPSKYNLNHINKIAQIFSISPSDLLPDKPL